MDNNEPNVIEREIHHVETRRSGPLAGFIVAVLLVVAAVVGFIIVTDDDVDPPSQEDLPSVDVDVQE